ncbi:GDP-mannose 4,6-dehydratase [Candidatus Woesearchaeota archaeon]|nr:GDP-mannose 4,6-dehydratase [Candidatus Woesearchaeota archaeon]
MKSLITGIGGFVGPYLARHLLSKKHEVIGIEREPKASVDGCRVFACDVLDREGVSRIIMNEKPDFIFHLAAISSVSQSLRNPELANRINIDGIRNILDAVSAHCPGSAVLVVSTAHVYGIPKRLPLDEGHPANPVSDYGKSRLAQENLALSYFRKGGLKVVVSRSFNHTGPGQPAGFICSDFARQIAGIERGNEPVMKVGNLAAERDFSDVRDIVRAYSLALEKCSPGEVYNICSGKSYSGKHILGLMLSMSDKKISVVEDRIAKKGDIPVLVGDNSKFVAATGWHPEIPFETTIRDVLEYWRGKV